MKLLHMIQATRTPIRIAFLLMLGGTHLFPACRDSRNSPEHAVQSLKHIDAEIAKVFAQYRIDEKSIRTSNVVSRDGTFTRVIRRILVAPEFNSLSFNHSLSSRIASTGAMVAATEEPEKKTVTMHIKKDGLIVESLVFVMTKTEKEKDH